MKKVSVLIVLLAILFGCSKEEPKEKPIKKTENTPKVVVEEPKPVDMKTDPKKWFIEEINRRDNSLYRGFEKKYSPRINLIAVDFKDGVLDVHYAFDVEGVFFPSRQINILDISGAKISAGEAYIAETELILPVIYKMSKEIEIKTVKLKSTAILETTNQWGETSEKDIIMFKALYNKSNLERIFKAYDNNESISVRKNAASFYGRMRNPAE